MERRNTVRRTSTWGRGKGTVWRGAVRPKRGRRSFRSAGWGRENGTGDRIPVASWEIFPASQYMEDRGRTRLLTVGERNYEYAKKKTIINPEVSNFKWSLRYKFMVLNI